MNALLPALAVLAAAPKIDVYLTLSTDGPWLKTRLTNGGTAPVELYLGRTCGGADAFEAVLDGKAQPFPLAAGPCDKDEPIIRTLAPAYSYEVPPHQLDGRAHTVVVRYRPGRKAGRAWGGTVSSTPLKVGPTWSLELAVRPGAGGHPEVVHTNAGAAPLNILTAMSCGGPVHDTLVEDGKPTALAVLTPDCRLNRMDWRELKPGESFASTATWPLAPGRHSVVAQYGGQCVDARGTAFDCQFTSTPLELVMP